MENTNITLMGCKWRRWNNFGCSYLSFEL